jgi:hypothetical protein
LRFAEKLLVADPGKGRGRPIVHGGIEFNKAAHIEGGPGLTLRAGMHTAGTHQCTADSYERRP